MPRGAPLTIGYLESPAKRGPEVSGQTGGLPTFFPFRLPAGVVGGFARRPENSFRRSQMAQLEPASIADEFAELSGARAAEVLAEGVLRHPSILARLIHIAGLTKDYADAGRLLARMHLEIFVYWLGLSLRQKKCDAAVCCGSPEPDRRMLKDLRHAAEQAIPPGAMRPERQLFLHELELVVALLSNEE